MLDSEFWQRFDRLYPDLQERLDTLATPVTLFDTFKQLSDNYSPTLTVSRVQGPVVSELMAKHEGVSVDVNLRRSGSIGITVGAEPAPVWFSSHADICSYLTEPRQAHGYPLTPFCMPRAAPGRRPAVALGNPAGPGPLAILAEGDMVTSADGSTYFDTLATDLPLWTRVVYQSEASWDRESDEAYGYIDNHSSCAAHVVAARILSQYEGVNAMFVLNDEEEGPVDKGNQGFSRALNRLLHRTAPVALPDLVVVSDTHQQEQLIDAGEPSDFGAGAIFSGYSSNMRGAVTPPQLVDFNRLLIDRLNESGVLAKESHTYVGRSDDISALQFTPNVVIVGAPGTSSHFDKTPTIRVSDLVNLTKTLVIYALVAQDADWRAHYL